MSLIDWNEKLNTGIKEIDAQHHELVGFLNSLHDAMRVGKGKEVVQEILNGLTQYTVKHFATEEKLMFLHSYSDYIKHKNEHHILVEEVKDFKKKYDAGTAKLTIELMQFLRNWLIEHIQGSDLKLGEYLKEKGIS